MKSCVSLRPAGFWHIRRCQLLFPASVSGCCNVFKGVSWSVFNAYLDGQFWHCWEVMLLDQVAVKIFFFFFFLRRIRAKSIHLFNSRVKWAKNATQPLLQSNIKRTPLCGSWFRWNGRDFKSCDHLGGANFILPGWGSRQTGVYLPGLVQHSSEGTSPDKKRGKMSIACEIYIGWNESQRTCASLSLRSEAFPHSAVLKTITIRSVGHHTVPRLRRHRALAPLLPSSEYRRAESRTDCGITNGDDLCLISKRERAVAGINIYSWKHRLRVLVAAPAPERHHLRGRKSMVTLPPSGGGGAGGGDGRRCQVAEEPWARWPPGTPAALSSPSVSQSRCV